MADRDRERGALEQAASTAHTIHGAIKTGKAIAGAAKGAAAGGPYGAVAGLSGVPGNTSGQLPLWSS